MRRSDASFTTLEGTVVSLHSPRLNIAPYGATNELGVKLEGKLHLFGSSNLEYTELIMESPAATVTGEYSLGGRRLLLAEAPDVEWKNGKQIGTITSAFWEASEFMVYSQIYNGTQEDLIALFDRFEFLEAPDGLSMRPKQGNKEELELIRDGRFAPAFSIHITGIGALTVYQLTVEQARQLPAGAGETVRGGELFTQGVESKYPMLLLVGENTVTRIQPDEELDDSQVLEGVSELEVSATSSTAWAA